MEYTIVTFLPGLVALLLGFLATLMAYVVDGVGEEYKSRSLDSVTRRRRFRILFLAIAALAAGFVPSLLPDDFPARFGTGKLTTLLLGIPIALAYFFSATWMLSRFGSSRSERRENVELVCKLLEAGVLVLGVAFAVHAANSAIVSLKRNADNNLTTARAQLYEADFNIIEAESVGAGTRLLTLYANPKPTDDSDDGARLYIRNRLSLVSDSDDILNAQTASSLYAKFYGPSSFSSLELPERTDIVELRRMLLHCTLVLNTLHAAFDNIPAIITDDEFETWAGYLKDIGPHPVLLTTLWLWSERGYMSKGFAEQIQEIIYHKSESPQKRVISLFYEDLAKNTFGDELPPDYRREDPESVP